MTPISRIGLSEHNLLKIHNPYSPDLNPIEQAFSKLKTLLRKADERCVETVWRRLGSLLDHISPAECQNYFVKDGYAST